MAATRTQVYLTKEQRARLDDLRRREGKSLAEVIREAVEEYLDRPHETIEQALEATAGSVPDLEVPPRSEWGRGYG